MNKQRRIILREILDRLTDLHDELDNVRDEEECAKDNLPESFWETERYERMEEACENLESALSSLEEAFEYIDAAME